MSYPSITAAGFDSAQYSYRTTGGVLAGVDNLVVTTSNGLSSPMGRLKGVVTSDVTLPTPVEVAINGDDSRLATFQFDSTEPVAFDIDVAISDSAFKTRIEATASVTSGEAVMVPYGLTQVVAPGFILLLSGKAKSAASGTAGSAGFRHLLLFNVEFRDLGAGFNFQGAATRRYRVTANASDTLPDGRTVASVFPAVPGGQMLGLEFTTVKRCTFASFMGDNTITSPVLAQKPISTATTIATLETTGYALDTVTAVDTTTPYGCTLTGTPGAGKRAVVRYQFENWE